MYLGSRRLVFPLCIPLLLLLAPSPARSQDACSIVSALYVGVGDMCLSAAQILVQGGTGSCKPLASFSAQVEAVRTLVQPEFCRSYEPFGGCPYVISAAELRVANSNPALRTLKASASVIPVRINFKARTTGYGGSYTAAVVWSGGGVSRTGGSVAGALNEIVTAQIPVTIAEYTGRPSDSTEAVAAGSMTASATACGSCTVGWNAPQVTRCFFQVTVDPFVEVDPDWPDAASYVVERRVSSADEWAPLDRGIADPVPFSDVSTLLPAVPGVGAFAGAWGDYDDDGDPDLFMGYWDFDTPSRLMRNDGGTFVEVASPELAALRAAWGAVWVDYDGDGDLDLHVSRGAFGTVMMRNDGGVFTQSHVPQIEFDADSRSLAWADYDLDGDLDLYATGTNLPGRLVRNDGPGGFTRVTPPVMDFAGYAQTAEWADIDDDGDPDLFVTYIDASPTDRLYRNNGDGTFTDITAGAMADAGAGVGASFGDYDNDGRMDLYVANNGSLNHLYRNLGGGAFADSTDWTVGMETGSTSLTWADFDNDGWVDMYVSITGSGTTTGTGGAILMNEGGQEFENSIHHTLGPAEPPGNWWGVNACDYDLDGDLDVLLKGGGVRLLRNDRPSSRHWLRIALRREGANRFGVGARIRVVANGLTQTRQMFPSGSPYRGDPLVAHFGLDLAGLVDTLEIRWPSGHVERYTGIVADRQITVYENQGITGVAPDAPHPVVAVLKACRPNPAMHGTNVAFELPSAGRVTIRVYDLLGRLVRVLSNGELRPSGSQEIRWDGLDHDGRTLSPGLYVVRLETPGVNAQQKVALIR